MIDASIALRSTVSSGAKFGAGTDLVRMVGPWPRDEPLIIFGGVEGYRYESREADDGSNLFR